MAKMIVSNSIKEISESTDFNCQRTNLVQLWLRITYLINNADIKLIYRR